MKVTNKQTANTFRKVKKYMQEHVKASEFICNNTVRKATDHTLRDVCIDIIQERIGENNSTLNNWLVDQGYPDVDKENKHKVKECRINRLTSLIEEFENKKDE